MYGKRSGQKRKKCEEDDHLFLRGAPKQEEVLDSTEVKWETSPKKSARGRRNDGGGLASAQVMDTYAQHESKEERCGPTGSQRIKM